MKSADLPYKDKALYPSTILIGYSAAVCLLWNFPRSTLLLEKWISSLKTGYHFYRKLSMAFDVLGISEIKA